MAKDPSKGEKGVHCGLIMPISSMEGLDAAHWADVKDILSSAVEDAGFVPNLVSEGDESSVIHKRIIQNIYEYPIMVCDVSGRNPNVMFELGMRLAFDKPTIVIKDEVTVYPFDTTPLEYTVYPRDLRFHGVVAFKERLAAKLRATFKKSVEDPQYSSYLGHLGQFKVAKLDTKEVPATELLVEQLNSLRSEMRSLASTVNARNSVGVDFRSDADRSLRRVRFSLPTEKIETALQFLSDAPGVRSLKIDQRNGDTGEIQFVFEGWGGELSSQAILADLMSAAGATAWGSGPVAF